MVVVDVGAVVVVDVVDVVDVVVVDGEDGAGATPTDSDTMGRRLKQVMYMGCVVGTGPGNPWDDPKNGSWQCTVPNWTQSSLALVQVETATAGVTSVAVHVGS